MLYAYVTDIDECSLDSKMCLNGRCKNMQGSYHCDCDPGFSVKPGKSGCTGKFDFIYEILIFFNFN